MKKSIKLLFILSLSMLFCNLTYAQNCCSKINYTNWVMQRGWSNGFQALPDVCTNLSEFYSQYHKNKKQWDAVFAWLAQTDLQTIPAGKHQIPDTELFATVEDGVNDPLEKRGSESHYHHIDLQYVVKGTERFASKAMFIDSTPERFFLFFPSDWHIAKIQTDKEDQNIRVVVVKLDYIK